MSSHVHLLDVLQPFQSDFSQSGKKHPFHSVALEMQTRFSLYAAPMLYSPSSLSLDDTKSDQTSYSYLLSQEKYKQENGLCRRPGRPTLYAS